ncbi:Fe-S cluster assembly protein SufB [candidate division KSB1 bacterium]|nr:Fe-S cluster assembly protein SufB [candidate division KSB1 bacterium]
MRKNVEKTEQKFKTAELIDEVEIQKIKNIESEITQEYKHGWVTDIEEERIPIGLSEEVVRMISNKKDEPEWLLEWRLKAYRHWLTMKEPTWAAVDYKPIDYKAISYYSAPKNNKLLKSLDEVDPALLKTYEKLGIPLMEQKRLAGVATDIIFDSVSITTTFKEELGKLGIIFCAFSEAVHEHPDLVRKYVGSVVPYNDNFFAALNSAVFSDGSFCYIPKGVKCPMDLSTYFRINAENTGQFERTLIIAEEDSFVRYLEGCSAPMRDENQLHAAVVELIAHDNAVINYSTIQNWYPGDKNGVGGIYNFVTKRGLCKGKYSNISWTQVETGSAITWKYPGCILEGDYSVGEFYSVAVANNYQQADTGTKMIHIGKNTRSKIVSKGISAGHGKNTYRGMVKIMESAENAKNFTQCDSMMIGSDCVANTFPVIDVRNSSSTMEHEAYTGKIGEEQLFYLMSRGIPEEEAVALIVTGFCSEIVKKLPLEFSVEAVRLIEVCAAFPDALG